MTIGVTSKRMTKTTAALHLRGVDFTPQKLSIEFDRPRDNLLTVTFALATAEFEEASRRHCHIREKYLPSASNRPNLAIEESTA